MIVLTKTDVTNGNNSTHTHTFTYTYTQTHTCTTQPRGEWKVEYTSRTHTDAVPLVCIVNIQVVQSSDGDDVLLGVPRVVQDLLAVVQRVNVEVTRRDSRAEGARRRGPGPHFGQL